MTTELPPKGSSCKMLNVLAYMYLQNLTNRVFLALMYFQYTRHECCCSEYSLYLFVVFIDVTRYRVNVIPESISHQNHESLQWPVGAFL